MDHGTVYVGRMFQLPSGRCAAAPDQSEANKRWTTDCWHQRARHILEQPPVEGSVFFADIYPQAESLRLAPLSGGILHAAYGSEWACAVRRQRGPRTRTGHR